MVNSRFLSHLWTKQSVNHLIRNLCEQVLLSWHCSPPKLNQTAELEDVHTVWLTFSWEIEERGVTFILSRFLWPGKLQLQLLFDHLNVREDSNLWQHNITSWPSCLRGTDCESPMVHSEMPMKHSLSCFQPYHRGCCWVAGVMNVGTGCWELRLVGFDTEQERIQTSRRCRLAWSQPTKQFTFLAVCRLLCASNARFLTHFSYCSAG